MTLYSSTKYDDGRKTVTLLGGLLKKVSTDRRRRFYLAGVKIMSLPRGDSSRRKHKASPHEILRELKELRQELCSFRIAQNNALVVAAQHQKIFPQYRDINKGGTAVIVATGPTMAHYTPLPHVVHIGVNAAFLRKNIPLDYLFFSDFHPIHNDLDELRETTCPKFFAQCADPLSMKTRFVMNSNHDVVKALPSYLKEFPNSQLVYFKYVHDFPRNIEVEALPNYSTCVTMTLAFALHTGVKKIYIVGCDTTPNGHFNGVPCDRDFNTQSLINGWLKFSDFRRFYYPDVEIISVNPIGLKGLFTDVYTESYLSQHPEIDKNTVTILRADELANANVAVSENDEN